MPEPGDSGPMCWRNAPAIARRWQRSAEDQGRPQRRRKIKGWFRDTLPAAPIERLAVLRLDGDLYESTIQALESLYDRGCRSAAL